MVVSHPAKRSWHFPSVSCCLPRAVFADGLTFSLPLVLTAVSAAHWLSFYKLLFTGFSLSTLSASLKKMHFCVSFWFQFCLFCWFSFLKLHKGTRTHAQLPRRPVPPPKPRRSKKGVSRCRLWLPTSLLYSLLWFASLSVFFTWAFALSVAASHSATRGDF